MRKVFIFVLSLILGLSSICYAFADDDSGEVSSSPELSPEAIEFISQASDDDDRQLRQAAAIMAATSTYDIDDIYSILSSVRMIDNSRYVFATFDESTWSEIHNVYNALISNYYNNTWYSISNLVAQLLTQFSSFSSNFYSPVSGSATLWQLSDDIKTFVGLGLFDSNANPYLSLINSGLSSLNSTSITSSNRLLAIYNSIDNVDSNVTSILNTGLPQVISASNNTTNAVNNVKSSVDSLDSDFNFINWSDGTFYGVSLDTSNNYISSSSTAKDFYYHISIPTKSSYAYLETRINSSDFKMDISSISISGYSTSYFFPLTFKIVSTYPTLSLFIYFDDVVIRQSTSQHLLKISFNSNKTVTANSAVYKLINFDSFDFYYIDNFMKLDRFTSIYASDDILAAKQNQQSYEDQAITDFTGSGSAAAKGSDLTNLKSVSGTIQSGLQTGGSVSNALAPFNPSGGFWGWFSQSNSDDINNPSLRRRDDQFIDFYSDNQYLLHSLLQGDDR